MSPHDVHPVSQNLAKLLTDPAGMLQRSEIRIAPSTKHGLTRAVGVLAIGVPLLLMLKFRMALSWPILLAISAGIAVVGLVVVAIRPFGVELVLTPAGVRVRRRATEVFCPWSLFNVSGNVLVRPHELILPIAPKAIPFVQQYYDERLVRQGTQLKTPLLRFQNGREVVLLPQLGAPAEQVGRLLLHLGRALGHRLPAESVPAEAYPAPDAAGPALFAGQTNGWTTVILTALRFPRKCCNCSAPADQVWSLEAGFRQVQRMGGLAYHNERVTLRVPVCNPCWKEVKGRQRRGRWIGVGLGLLVAVLGTLSVLPWLPPLNGVSPFVFGALAGMAMIVGYLAGAWAADRRYLPVRAARYSGTMNTVDLWFRRPAYADAVHALMQDQRSPTTDPVTSASAPA